MKRNIILLEMKEIGMKIRVKIKLKMKVNIKMKVEMIMKVGGKIKVEVEGGIERLSD